MSAVFVSIFVYADDIVLIAPSVGSLQTLLALLETLLENMDMRINALKSACIRFGPRHDADCANLTMKNGDAIAWVSTCRYLGVYFVSGRELKCCFDQAKQKFFRSFNAIFSKVGRSASEEVFLSLFCAKCVPVLLYAVEACPVNKRTKNSFDFSINRIFMKLFRTGSVALVEDCQRFLNFLPASYQVDVKTVKFFAKIQSVRKQNLQSFWARS